MATVRRMAVLSCSMARGQTSALFVAEWPFLLETLSAGLDAHPHEWEELPSEIRKAAAAISMTIDDIGGMQLARLLQKHKRQVEDEHGNEVTVEVRGTPFYVPVLFEPAEHTIELSQPVPWGIGFALTGLIQVTE